MYVYMYLLKNTKIQVLKKTSLTKFSREKSNVISNRLPIATEYVDFITIIL